MNKNYLISTGGSGGHVIPATILYEHLIKERNVIISCDKRGLKYLEKNYEYKIIDTPKPVSYTHLLAHETNANLVLRLQQ